MREDNLTQADWERIERDRDTSLRQQTPISGSKLRRIVAEHVLNDLFGFMKHPLFDRNDEPERLYSKRRPLCRREAYMWLIERTVKRDGLTREGYRVSSDFVFPVGRGEFCRAEQEMGEAWNWTRKAVRTFLETLEGVGELRKISAVGYTQQRLAALRVPSAYSIARVVSWYHEAELGIIDGVEVAADDVADFAGASSGARSETKSATLNRPLNFNSLGKGEKESETGASKSASGETKSATAKPSSIRVPLAKGHAFGHAKDGENEVKSTAESNGRAGEGPRKGPTKDTAPVRFAHSPPLTVTVATDDGLVRQAFKRKRGIVVPVASPRRRQAEA